MSTVGVSHPCLGEGRKGGRREEGEGGEGQREGRGKGEGRRRGAEGSVSGFVGLLN